MIRRSVRLVGLGKELPLSKYVAVESKKEFFYLEKLPSGTWRLTVSTQLIPDMTKLVALEIVRDDT